MALACEKVVLCPSRLGRISVSMGRKVLNLILITYLYKEFLNYLLEDQFALFIPGVKEFID